MKIAIGNFRCGAVRPFAVLAAAALSLTFLVSANAHPRPIRASNSKAVAMSPAPSPSITLAADKGRFRISVNGQPIGTEEFEIRPNGDHWVAQGTTELKPAQGAATRVTSRLTLQADGTPASYNWSTEGAKKASADIAFQGNVATIVLRVEGAKPFTQQFTFSSPQIVVLDNNAYNQYAILARLYDREKMGAQTFSVLVPQEMTPGSVTVDSLGEITAGSAKFEELRVKTADLEVDLYLDTSHRLMRLVAPSSNAEVVRE
jgi:hypothetical protein